MLPSSRLYLRFNFSTRAADPTVLATVTRSHSRIERSADQFSTVLPFVPLVKESSAASRFVQSTTSPGLEAGSGTVVPLKHWSTNADDAAQDGNPNDAKSLFSTSNSAAGMHPVRSLPPSRNRVRLVRLPNSDGISPVSWLLLRFNCVRLVRLRNSNGILPSSCLSLMFNCSIRFSELTVLATVTPFHSRIERPADQFSTEPSFANEDSADSKFAQSNTSPGFDSGSGTTVPLEHFAFNVQEGRPNSVISLLSTSNSVAGMHPVRSLPTRRKSDSLVRVPNSDGISPVS